MRARGAPLDLVGAVRAQLREIDPELPVYGVRNMTDVLSGQLDQPRMVSSLLSAFAVLALILVVVGVYGVIAYGVTARVREIGVRLAFGAAPRQILGLLLRQSLVPVAIGIVVGLLAAASLTRFMSSLIYGVQAIDPFIFLAVAAILALAALAASLIPAWKAPGLESTRVGPAEALRHE